MRFDRFTALFVASNILLGASAGPLAAKRQDETSSASSSAPTAAFFPSVSTMSNGEETTIEVIAPTPTQSSASESTTGTGETSVTATSTDEAPSTTPTVSPTELPDPASDTSFPFCHDPDAKPFCLPKNESTLYVGKPYYATWNPDFFPANSSVFVKVLFSNDSAEEVWSSEKTENSLGFVVVETTKEWLNGYSMFNLSFVAINFEGDDPTKKAVSFDGPRITIENEPPKHLPPSQVNKLHKEGLMIGLPVGLGFILLVVVGLLFGMRKHRTIGLGNIMGRRNRGYGVRQSRRQRLGLKTKGAIRLENMGQPPKEQYTDAPPRTRSDSLGSLVSDDGDAIRPAPRGNQFRDEIQRQKTGR